MYLGEELFRLKQERDGLWYVYDPYKKERVVECGRWGTKEEANQAAIDFYDC